MPDHAQCMHRTLQRQGLHWLKDGDEGQTESEKGVECGKRRHQVSRKPNGYIRTEQAYRDYKVMVEWRFTKAATRAFWSTCTSPTKSGPRCFECQGMHNRQGDFWLWGGAIARNRKFPARTGSRCRERSNEKGGREWNTYEVECSGKHDQRLSSNGKLIRRHRMLLKPRARSASSPKALRSRCGKISIEPLKELSPPPIGRRPLLEHFARAQEKLHRPARSLSFVKSPVRRPRISLTTPAF